MITHHLAEEFLIEYSTGSLGEAESIIVASHISMCAVCRNQVGIYEDVGAALLEEGEMTTVDADSFTRILDKIDRQPEAGPVAPDLDRETLQIVPPPFRVYLGGSLSSLVWNWIGPGIREANLAQLNDFQVSLFRIRAGTTVPAHTHARQEFTLLLEGGFTEGDMHFGKGDVSLADDTVTHSHLIDRAGPCLCLTARNGRMKLTGPFLQLLNPVIRL